jgi:pyruvate, water dikinase
MIVLPEGSESNAAAIGNKAFALDRLAEAGLPVPPFFCVSVSGMTSVSVDDLDSALAGIDADSVAVRSSGVDEDRREASFAGVHATRLNVISAGNVKRALHEISESAFSTASLAYRRQRGLSGPPQIAAAVQKMVRADVSGVIFTKDPIQNSDSVIVEACWGLGEALVGGAVTPDRWVLSRNGAVLSARISDKDLAVVADSGGGTRSVEVEETKRRCPCLGADSLQRFLALALECERLFGEPQDVEWALASQELWLLQSRPIL